MSAADAGLARVYVANERPPSIRVRYFYASQLALDDPLSPVPAPTTATAASRIPPRPLSKQDSEAVEKAWTELRHKLRVYREEQEKHARLRDRTAQPSPATRLRAKSVVGSLSREQSLSKRSSQASDEFRSASLGKTFPAVDKRSSLPVSDGKRISYADDQTYSSSPKSVADVEANFDIGESNQGTTGTPFVRAPRRKKASIQGTKRSASPPTPRSRHPSSARRASSISEDLQGHDIYAPSPEATVPVGVSRLHEVVLPNFQLQPIYWSPANDIAKIIRGTWFYKDTLLPVETDIANLLEAGYVKLRPWTSRWADELSSAAHAGPAGEEKIAHILWPKASERKPNSRPGTSASTQAKGEETSPDQERKRIVNSECERIDLDSGPAIDNKAAGDAQYGNDGKPKLYKQAVVIYADRQEAYILRPNLQPSAYYRRKPYAEYIRKGRSIGVPIVRGFDEALWERLHPTKTGSTARKAYAGASAPDPQRASPAIPSGTGLQNPQVTDLVLVIHGIGQKLSERVESYNFTYAMNDFRREFNVQLGSNTVQPHLRRQMGSIMVLPVNWRSTLSFEEGGYRDEENDPAANEYSLQDITPDSLPNVRNIVSDVMLDIPYYLSHHQPRMIQALVDETNRIFSLWCKNNPGFDKWGRVHLVAHSLGSVMAIDVLSAQPTHVDMRSANEHNEVQKHFIFNTSNLFLCGSPAGFFLLLRKVGLRPRAAQEKLMSSAVDTDQDVGEEAGIYGCIAVENVYNILNPYDPVSYRLNAAVDSVYAASLKHAVIPSAAAPWFSFGASARSGYSKSSGNGRGQRPDPGQRFPSTMELETHNFTREEIAEKRAYLLNDNGQIDYFLRYGGGPLEIQYLTMLSAHSSYWTSQDFIRFLVIEIGREPGRECALEALKASKKKTLPITAAK
ncbi:MAG: hypothetical protein Q9162_001415 [Coniocarpon cinnabarinum]